MVILYHQELVVTVVLFVQQIVLASALQVAQVDAEAHALALAVTLVKVAVREVVLVAVRVVVQVAVQEVVQVDAPVSVEAPVRRNAAVRVLHHVLYCVIPPAEEVATPVAIRAVCIPVEEDAMEHHTTMDKTLNTIRTRKDAWQDGVAKNITFIVTKDCQLACKYCYLVGKNTKERMPWKIAKQAVDYILVNEDFQQPSVVFDFIGGEPFLEIGLINQICDYIKTELFRLDHHWFNSYRFSFSTNGINYHEQKIQNFIEKNKSHLSIGITIDGTEMKHNLNRVYKGSGKGSYQDVLRNIPLWLSQFPDGGTKVTISSDDLPYVKESVLHLYSLGIHEVNINCVFEDVWHDGDDMLFESQLLLLADAIIDGGWYQDYSCSFFSEMIGKPLDRVFQNQNWCGAGMMLAVDAAGNFYPCTRFASYSLRSKRPIIIGNIYDGIDKNKLRPFLTLDRTTQSPQKCIDCEVASGCAWCQGENYDAAVTNTIYQRATAICKMHKARVRANNYYWNKLYRKLELEGGREEFEKNNRKVKPETC